MSGHVAGAGGATGSPAVAILKSKQEQSLDFRYRFCSCIFKWTQVDVLIRIDILMIPCPTFYAFSNGPDLIF